MPHLIPMTRHPNRPMPGRFDPESWNPHPMALPRPVTVYPDVVRGRKISAYFNSGNRWSFRDEYRWRVGYRHRWRIRYRDGRWMVHSDRGWNRNRHLNQASHHDCKAHQNDGRKSLVICLHYCSPPESSNVINMVLLTRKGSSVHSAG
jgi:hypothetical protein